MVSELFQMKENSKRFLSKPFNIQRPTLSKETSKSNSKKLTSKEFSKVLFTLTRRITPSNFWKEVWLSVWVENTVIQNIKRLKVLLERTRPDCGPIT